MWTHCTVRSSCPFEMYLGDFLLILYYKSLLALSGGGRVEQWIFQICLSKISVCSSWWKNLQYFQVFSLLCIVLQECFSGNSPSATWDWSAEFVCCGYFRQTWISLEQGALYNLLCFSTNCVCILTDISAWVNTLEVLAAEHHMSKFQGAFLLQRGNWVIIFCVNFCWCHIKQNGEWWVVWLHSGGCLGCLRAAEPVVVDKAEELIGMFSIADTSCTCCWIEEGKSKGCFFGK